MLFTPTRIQSFKLWVHMWRSWRWFRQEKLLRGKIPSSRSNKMKHWNTTWMQSYMKISSRSLRRRSFKREISKLRALWVLAVHTCEEHRPMEIDEHRTTHPVQHRLTPSMESVASCETVRIMTHEKFTGIHLHPTKPYHITTEDINRHHEPVTNRRIESDDDRLEFLVPVGDHLSPTKCNYAKLM